MTPREQFIADCDSGDAERFLATYDALVAERDEARDRVARIVAWLDRALTRGGFGADASGMPTIGPLYSIGYTAAVQQIRDAIEAGDYGPPKEPR